MKFAIVPFMMLASLTGLAEAPEVSRLFDGESLSGWTAIGSTTGNWRVESGCLLTVGNGKGWLSTNRAYSDFEIWLEYQLARGGNSGVLIRAPHQGDPSFEGMEIQLLDDESPVYRSLRPDQYTGSIYGVIPATRGHSKPAGAWNSMRIVVKGSRVLVELNDVKILEGDVASRPDVLPRHKGILRTSGFIGLQSHESRAWFRKLEIREIR